MYFNFSQTNLIEGIIKKLDDNNIKAYTVLFDDTPFPYVFVGNLNLYEGNVKEDFQVKGTFSIVVRDTGTSIKYWYRIPMHI